MFPRYYVIDPQTRERHDFERSQHIAAESLANSLANEHNQQVPVYVEDDHELRCQGYHEWDGQMVYYVARPAENVVELLHQVLAPQGGPVIAAIDTDGRPVMVVLFSDSWATPEPPGRHSAVLN
jgi:hypothetical protein